METTSDAANTDIEVVYNNEPDGKSLGVTNLSEITKNQKTTQAPALLLDTSSLNFSEDDEGKNHDHDGHDTTSNLESKTNEGVTAVALNSSSITMSKTTNQLLMTKIMNSIVNSD